MGIPDASQPRFEPLRLLVASAVVAGTRGVKVRLADGVWAKTGEVAGGTGHGAGFIGNGKKTRLAGKMWLR
jgi:hypothetical protein